MKSNRILLITMVAGTTLFLASCTSQLRLTTQQSATMSHQAVDTLKSLRLVRVPLINVADKQLIKARQQFAEVEKGQLVEMKQKFNPIIEDTLINGVKVSIITPQHISPENKDRIIIYIHGGGFIMGSATDRTGMLMANEMGLKMYSIDYKLAPEAKYPIAMDEALEVYKFLISKYKPQNIVGVSTSAGSTHMMAMLLKAKQQNLPMINSIALLSPGVDLTNVGDSPNSNDGRDLLAYKNMGDKMMIRPFAGTASLTDPLVSPIYANYTSDFPATTIVTGTRDVFLSSSTRLYWKLKEANVSAELLVGEGMWHAYTNYTSMQEAVQARKATQDFMLNHLSNKSKSNQTNIKSNKSIVQKFIDEVINKGSIDLVDELWASDLIWHGGSMGDVYGIENYKRMLTNASKGSFVNMKLEIKEILEDGNKVVLYFTNSGKNIGDFMGNKATGKFAKWDGMGVYKIENGKIKEAWFSEDILGMFIQLGFINNK